MGISPTQHHLALVYVIRFNKHSIDTEQTKQAATFNSMPNYSNYANKGTFWLHFSALSDNPAGTQTSFECSDLLLKEIKLLGWRYKQQDFREFTVHKTITFLQWPKYWRPVAEVYMPVSTMLLCEGWGQQQGNSREYICRTKLWEPTCAAKHQSPKEKTQQEKAQRSSVGGKEQLSAYIKSFCWQKKRIIHLWKLVRLRTRNLNTSQAESSEGRDAAKGSDPNRADI